ncbi:SpoIVB peptidase S55 domain-containing protein [Nocardioides sp.]|uniref:SpoIVB peptidase S55 domain-containing protein n=1 Tax=Nocardioides sp. TaxID=35761 RepID=UPI0035668FAA
MRNSFTAGRRRALASSAALTGLVLSGLAATSVSAQSAPPDPSADPPADCAVPFPVADVAKGDAVNGLTVSDGTTPEPFTGEVLGVLEDGIAADLDMVMVRLNSAEIDRVGGIWSGMSGSPVYASDGRLIGAVAYGLSWGPSPVAGVTPFEEMDDYLGGVAPRRIPVTKEQARAIARDSEVTRAQAEQGFAQLKMPMGVSGVRAGRLAQAKRTKQHPWLPHSTYRAGAVRAAGQAPGAETIEAGGNMAASLSYGTVTMAAVGTATSVCDGEVVGFGHPMTFLGQTTLSLHPADALYIQEDSVGSPYKMANLGSPVGTVTDDHLSGISGPFGPLPETSAITSHATYLTRDRTGETHVSVPEAMPAATFYQVLSTNDRVRDGYGKGSALLDWTISGHVGADPFELSATDRYASEWDITYESAWPVADLIWALSSISDLSIDEVRTDNAIDDDSSTWRVVGVEQYRKGAWRSVSRKVPALAKAGRKLVLGINLRSSADRIRVPVRMMVPRKAGGSGGRISALGGGMMWSELGNLHTIEQAERYVASLVRNDQVAVELSLEGRRRPITVDTLSDPTEKVVLGRKWVRVLVR